MIVKSFVRVMIAIFLTIREKYYPLPFHSQFYFLQDISILGSLFLLTTLMLVQGNTAKVIFKNYVLLMLI